MSLITTGDTCYNPATPYWGKSMQTFWKLEGMTTVYAGTLT